MTSDPAPPAGSDVFYFELAASAETAAVVSDDDAADDSVVIVSADASATWIATADKKYGLRVYTTDGREIHSLPVGRINNIDAVPLDKDRWLLAASNRSDISIDLYVADLGSGSIDRRQAVQLDLQDPYGLCMASLAGQLVIFVGDKDGLVQRWDLDSTLAAEQSASLLFDSQTEGCVVDPQTGTLFVGEETAGIWAINLDSGQRSRVATVDGETLVADVEGLDLYRDDDRHWLLASSQGDNSYVIYDLADDNRALAKFRIVASDDGRIDGTSETDGIALRAAALPDYPDGILVVQDGSNTLPAANQNFKIVDWGAIESAVSDR